MSEAALAQIGRLARRIARPIGDLDRIDVRQELLIQGWLALRRLRASPEGSELSTDEVRFLTVVLQNRLRDLLRRQRIQPTGLLRGLVEPEDRTYEHPWEAIDGLIALHRLAPEDLWLLIQVVRTGAAGSGRSARAAQRRVQLARQRARRILEGTAFPGETWS